MQLSYKQNKSNCQTPEEKAPSMLTNAEMIKIRIVFLRLCSQKAFKNSLIKFNFPLKQDHSYINHSECDITIFNTEKSFVNKSNVMSIFRVCLSWVL